MSTEVAYVVPVVILAGGKSRRMGRDKLDLMLGGQTLLEYAVSRFEADFNDVYISVSDESRYPKIASRRVVDALPGAGPLSGLHAALKTLQCDGVFLVAADLPFAGVTAARRIIEFGKDREACVIKLPDGNLEPLFAYYARSLLPICEKLISSGDNRMTGLYKSTDTRFVSVEELGDAWDEKLIYNVNFPDDYEKLMQE